MSYGILRLMCKDERDWMSFFHCTSFPVFLFGRVFFFFVDFLFFFFFFLFFLVSGAFFFLSASLSLHMLCFNDFLPFFFAFSFKVFFEVLGMRVGLFFPVDCL